MTEAHKTNGVDGTHLKAYLERIEKLEEERKELGEDVKEVFAEARGTGFDPKIMKKILALRKVDKNKRAEEDEILTCYMIALGMD